MSGKGAMARRMGGGVGKRPNGPTKVGNLPRLFQAAIMIEAFRQLRQSPYRLVLLILLGLAGFYLHGASLQNHLVNTNPRQTDQRSYLTFARELRETNYDYLVPRNQMPVYPLLQSLVYEAGMTEDEYFAVGKDFNIFLSLIILAALFWLFQRYFSPLMTLNLMLITAFTIFMFKAPFFQSELLFYLFNFGGFLLLIQMYRKPAVSTGLVTGVVFGIAHMTKASVIPGLALFLVIMVGRVLIDFFPYRVPYRELLRQRALPLALLFLAFFLSISGYISNSKKAYGHYFYNVNSTFYIWYDYWDEAKAGTVANGDRYGWPDMAEEDIPSPVKYFREHTPSQILKRVQDGLLRVISNSILSYGYAIYLLVYSILLFTFSLLNWRFIMAKIRQHFLLILFIGAYFVLYLLAVAWYTPIAKGNRFILAYFLPYMFILFYILRSTERFFGSQAGRLLQIVNVIVLCTLAGHIYYIMTRTIGSFYGGL
jgi:hypothetical protein